MIYKKGDKYDLAARAGWLYYVAGYNQEEIANEFGISRQSAQRTLYSFHWFTGNRFPIRTCFATSEKEHAQWLYHHRN